MAGKGETIPIRTKYGWIQHGLKHDAVDAVRGAGIASQIETQFLLKRVFPSIF